MLTDILEGAKEVFPRELDKYIPNIGLAWDLLSGGGPGFLVTAIPTYQKYLKNFQVNEQYRRAQQGIFAGSIIIKTGWEVFELLTGRVDPHIPLNLVHSALQTVAWIGGAYLGTYGFRDFRERIKSAYSTLKNYIAPEKKQYTSLSEDYLSEELSKIDEFIDKDLIGQGKEL